MDFDLVDLFDDYVDWLVNPDDLLKETENEGTRKKTENNRYLSKNVWWRREAWGLVMR